MIINHILSKTIFRIRFIKYFLIVLCIININKYFSGISSRYDVNELLTFFYNKNNQQQIKLKLKINHLAFHSVYYYLLYKLLKLF
jgi:hypothetical protein